MHTSLTRKSKILTGAGPIKTSAAILLLLLMQPIMMFVELKIIDSTAHFKWQYLKIRAFSGGGRCCGIVSTHF